jgi:hypothetical protein
VPAGHPGRHAPTPGSTIRLNGHVVMDHEAVVGFVDPQPKGVRRHHRLEVPGDKAILVPFSLLGAQLAMVGSTATPRCCNHSVSRSTFLTVAA